MNENNKVYLKGKVASEIQALHQVGNEAFYEFLVETQRLSGVKDVLPVTASERLVKAADIRVGAEICIFGDFVKVEGRIQSREYQKKRSETDIRTLTAYEVSCSCIAKEGG